LTAETFLKLCIKINLTLRYSNSTFHFSTKHTQVHKPQSKESSEGSTVDY